MIFFLNEVQTRN